MMKKTANLIFILGALVMGLTVTGCGISRTVANQILKNLDTSEEAEETKEQQTLEQSGQPEEKQEETEETKADGLSEDMLCGDWVLIGWDQEDYDQQVRRYVAADMYIESDMTIYQDEDGVYADYSFLGENSQTVQGMKVVFSSSETDTESSSIKADLEDRRNVDTQKTVTLVSENELWYTEVYLGGDEEYNYDASLKYVYYRKDSKEWEQADDWRYRETVTVSNAKELLQAIGSSKKILLEEGTYNLSEVPGDEIDNPSLEKFDIYEGQLLLDTQYTIKLIDNLCIMAKDDAEVTICTEQRSIPVLSFDLCNNIVLDYLTCGHDVEPGYCTGSVIYANNCAAIDIQRCKLYGSGSYGIEMAGVWDVTVENTDIFDCTYGLVSFQQASNVTFSNCSLSNSSGFSMFNLNGCSSMLWEECIVDGNKVEGSPGNFVESTDSWDITFRDCQFQYNSYEYFSNDTSSEEDGAVSLIDCVIMD